MRKEEEGGGSGSGWRGEDWGLEECGVQSGLWYFIIRCGPVCLGPTIPLGWSPGRVCLCQCLAVIETSQTHHALSLSLLSLSRSLSCSLLLLSILRKSSVISLADLCSLLVRPSHSAPKYLDTATCSDYHPWPAAAPLYPRICISLCPRTPSPSVACARRTVLL